MDECAYLKQRNVLTLSDFESYLSSVDEKVEDQKSSMNQKQQQDERTPTDDREC